MSALTLSPPNVIEDKCSERVNHSSSVQAHLPSKQTVCTVIVSEAYYTSHALFSCGLDTDQNDSLGSGNQHHDAFIHLFWRGVKEIKYPNPIIKFKLIQK